jgi:hypothetical protein
MLTAKQSCVLEHRNKRAIDKQPPTCSLSYTKKYFLVPLGLSGRSSLPYDFALLTSKDTTHMAAKERSGIKDY